LDVAKLRGHAPTLGFEPQDQVRWFAPVELVRIGIKVLLSTLFADFADRREVQAALGTQPIAVTPDSARHPDGSPDLDGGSAWFDMIADTGDGFDPTFSVAWTVSRDALEVTDPAGRSHRLPRGDALVFGGDEVYPTASARGYEDRTTGPYRAAFPAGSTAPGQEPLLLALPGNHDWYDGLTSFLRVFGQQRPLGGWRTAQTRSYFAVQLPGRWWLVGVDTQLGSYIDYPQIQYFRRELSQQLHEGDGVILLVPTPAWVHTVRDPDAFNSLQWFEQNIVEQVERNGVVQPTGAKVRLWLTGDSHHYARYVEDHPELPLEPPPAGPDPGEPDDGLRAAARRGAAPVATPVGAARQLVTCGLGGAFLSQTYDLPDHLLLPHPKSRRTLRRHPVSYSRALSWPDAATSRSLARRMLGLTRLGLAFRNPGLWSLAGVVQAAVVGVLLLLLGGTSNLGPTAALRQFGPADVLPMAGQAAIYLALLFVVVAAVLAIRQRALPPWQPLLEGFRAVALQLVVALALLAMVLAPPWPDRAPGWLIALAGLAAVVLVGGFLGSYALGVSIMLTRSHLIRGWQMTSQADEERKGFLRLHVTATAVTVYPVVIDEVCHDWRIEQDRPVPLLQLRPRLVEPPFTVARLHS
jgi:hypothetical protein